MFDIVITGGNFIDRTGAPARPALADVQRDHDASHFRVQLRSVLPAADQGAKEVWRVTGGEAYGRDIAIYRVDPLPQHEQYAWFTPAISFRGYDLIKKSFTPGDDLDLMFYWMSAERVTANYIVFVHVILVETGELLVGKDEPTGNGYHPTFTWGGDMQFNRDRHKLTIPATAKAGRYVVRFGLYDSDTKTRVQISTPKNDPLGDMVVLQEIRIEGK